MNKVFCFVLVVSCYSSIFARDSSVSSCNKFSADAQVVARAQNKKMIRSQFRSYKKNGLSKIQKYNQSTNLSVDETREMSEALKHLKRRYDRNYTLKYHIDKLLERDDFGYMPLSSK
jgi:hypothetical protein